MARQMLDAKAARLKVEQDREALANRIGRLQMEETRATKRIEQTHQRTQEIIAAKDEHHSQLQHKEMRRQEQEDLVAQHREYLRAVREEQRKFSVSQREAAEADRQALIRASKESAARNAEAIAMNRAADLNHAMYKRNEVRRVRALRQLSRVAAACAAVAETRSCVQLRTCGTADGRRFVWRPAQVEADARERKLREKELMIAHLQQRAGARKDEEEQRAEDLEGELASLEREEYELLVSLEGHKAERAFIYEHLEAAAGPVGGTPFVTSAPALVV
jgi:hypothetical protein